MSQRRHHPGHSATAVDRSSGSLRRGRGASASGPGRGPHGTAIRDRGSFTAELAAGLPALVLLLLVGLTAVSAVGAKLRCVDAAREAALAASRGEPGRPAGERVAPAGAAVDVRREGERVRAVVTATVHPLGDRLPAFTVSAAAVAAIEPGAAVEHSAPIAHGAPIEPGAAP